MENKGIKITPEMIEKIKVAKSPTELMELANSYEIGLDETAAKKWFEKLNSGELADKELSSVKGGGCFVQHCPKCGSTNYVQRFIPDSGMTGMLYCHCDDCGYDAMIPG